MLSLTALRRLRPRPRSSSGVQRHAQIGHAAAGSLCVLTFSTLHSGL